MPRDDVVPPRSHEQLVRDEAARAFAEAWEPRTYWKLWLAALSQSTDEYLRSAPFLELMQQGLRTMTRPWPFGPTSCQNPPAVKRDPSR